MSMYNKLFTKILDSSIWMESIETRIVWLTIIAAMDEHGYVRFASVENLAHRARVSTKAAQAAVKKLEGPDPNSSDPDNEGRRIERVNGGWMVLNALKYRGMVTKAIIQEQTKERVRRYRDKKRTCNGDVTHANENVTPSRAISESRSKAEREEERPALDGKPLDEIECPGCGRVGSLKQSQGRGGNPPGFWCDRRLGCGANWPLITSVILSQMTSRGRAAIEAMVPVEQRPYVSPGMIIASELKFDEKGMLIE